MREGGQGVLPFILATELLKLAGLLGAGCLLLIQQSQVVDALLHHGDLSVCPGQGGHSQQRSRDRREQRRHSIRATAKGHGTETKPRVYKVRLTFVTAMGLTLLCQQKGHHSKPSCHRASPT